MTAHAETLTPQRPQRFAADELDAAARWVSARCADAPPALLVDTFRALDAILVRSRGVVALRHLMPGSGLELLYLPPERDARVELASLPGVIHQAALAASATRGSAPSARATRHAPSRPISSQRTLTAARASRPANRAAMPLRTALQTSM